MSTVGNFLRRSARWLNGRSSGSGDHRGESVATTHPRIGTFNHARADIVRNNVELRRLNEVEIASMGAIHRELPVDVADGVTLAPKHSKNIQLIRSDKHSTHF